ncbi:hypothetical protein EYC80_000705 [Monilinia laxa]|uniref:ATP-dependent RNA helicase n=1 Tax=Monilinia laxa TaxID=61186 RepID=A0A5N6KBJ3_MONLA|nr:hypothetical protein EYC80_000705 [Monilinia laxa]
MFSRYIPPSKKKVIVKEQSVEVPPSSLKSTPPSPAIRPDASSSYARYIPPSKSKPNTQLGSSESTPDLPSPASKRKRNDASEPSPEPVIKKAKKDKREKSIKVPARISEDLHANFDASEEVEEVTKKDEKLKKKKSKDDSVPSKEITENEEDKDDKRHKKVLEKREKSTRKAERRARKAAEEGLDIEDTQEPEEPVEIHDLVPLPQPEPVPELPPPSLESTLPSWLASPILVSPKTTAQFSEVGVEQEAANVLRSRNFNEAFAVQAAVLPLLLPSSQQKPGDVLVSAATGSGKTLSYVLPMTQDISRNTVTRLRGLIVMPTRELVSQAREVCEVCSSAFSFGSRKRVKIGTAVGNEAFKAEQANLMENTYQYDPIRYYEQEKRKNSRWESSDAGIDDEGELLLADEAIPPLPDHIIEPVSRVDILICTPGRLVEHLKSTPGFTLQYIKWLIIDEADKLLDQSFQQWLDIVMSSLAAGQKGVPNNRDRVRKIILSATMTRDIGQLTSLKLYRPKLVVLEGSSAGDDGKSSQAHILPSGLVEFAVKVDDENLKPFSSSESSSDDESSKDSSSSDNNSESESDSKSNSKPEAIATPLPNSKSKSKTKPLPLSHEPHGVLIFTKSNESAIRLGRLLALIHPSYTNIIGTLTSTTRSSERKASLASFSRGKLQILVASDLVSRGLDLPDLAHVINYDVPTSITNYVHRVGRTARAGRQGHAWTLVGNSEARWFFNEVTKSEEIRRRDGGKVKRVVVDARKFGEYKKETYEDALEELGKEAMAIRGKKST